MKHILWVSRHSPTIEQTNLLSQIFDDKIVITQHGKSVENYQELIKEYEDGNFDDMVVTLPIDVIGWICKAGIQPIKAVHKMTGYEPATNFRKYEFMYFERIQSVSIVRKRLRGVKNETRPRKHTRNR